MSLVTAARIVRFAGQAFWRNIWLSLVTVSIIALAMISVNALVVVNTLTKTAITAVQNRIDVSFYFGNQVPETKVLEAKAFLTALPEVISVEYVSAAQSLEQFTQRHRNDPFSRQALEVLEDNPLGANLIVRARTLEDYDVILSRMSNSKYQELIIDKDYDDYRQYTGTINNYGERVRVGVAVMAVVFVAIALLIVFNAIRVTIYTQREEISIMRLVGASNWFIRMPYLIEGVLYAVIGCGLAYLLTVPVLNFLQPYVSTFFEGVPADIVGSFRSHALPLLTAQVVSISILTMASSAVAIRRYLRR